MCTVSHWIKIPILNIVFIFTKTAFRVICAKLDLRLKKHKHLLKAKIQNTFYTL